MSQWTNIGIGLTDEVNTEEIVEEIESHSWNIIGKQDGQVTATNFTSKATVEDIEYIFSDYAEGIEAFIVVHANDTSDTASGVAYDVDDNGNTERVFSEHSGGDDSRYDWYGISYKGVTLGGGKY